MKATCPIDVLPSDPPGLAVQVDGERVPVAAPDTLGRLSRVDLIVREARLVPDGRVHTVALIGVPAASPEPPRMTYNASVKQEPIAWVTVGPSQWEVRQEHIHTEWPPPDERAEHGCEEADTCVFDTACPHLTSCRLADDGTEELKAACREELADLWYDLHEARQSALNGRWSIRCASVQGRIEKLTMLVGPTPWGSIQIALLEDGLYQKINRDLGFEVEPDMARVAEVRARITAQRVT